MNDLTAFLKYKEIEKAFTDLGLDFNELFPEPNREKLTTMYKDYEWIVKNVPRFNTVINAVPPDEEMKNLPWEEWYSLDNKIHHHVLYLQEPSLCDEIFNAPDLDDIHPLRTLGKKWYVIDDPDMSPVLLRSSTSGNKQ